jgi:hypothetical protein
MNWPLLFADADDFIKLILIILFVVVPLIGQIIKSARGDQAAAKPPPKPPRRPPPREERRPQANVQGGGQDALRNEIDTFLQRAAQRRGADRARDVEILEPEVVAEVAPRRLVEAQPLPLGEAAEMGRRPLGADGLRPQVEPRPPVEQFGSSLELADEKVEGHLHKVFDHRLGSLADTSQAGSSQTGRIAEGTDAEVWRTPDSSGRQADSATPGALEIAAMLRNPSNLRDAIVLAEIFRRPEDRL